MDLTKEAIETLATYMGANRTVIEYPNAEPFMLVPNGFKREVIPGTRLVPVRKTGTATFTEVGSFCEFVNQQKLPESRIYCPNKTQFICVLNHHQESGTAGFGDFRAVLNLTHTPEWNTWKNTNTQKFGQRQFAVFIEDNVDDISSPSGADLLDLVRTFKATSNADFTGIIGEKPGNSTLSFVQQTKTQAGSKGDLEIPDSFALFISEYEGGQKHTILCRLRFEIVNGKLSIWFEMVKVEKLEQACLAAIADVIAAETEINVWYGTP